MSPVSTSVDIAVAFGFGVDLDSFCGGDKGSDGEEAEFHFELFGLFL